MITPERIEKIEGLLFTGAKIRMTAHTNSCGALYPNTQECNCIYRTARELLSELKDSLSREKKKREEVSRFASKLTEWIEEQIA